MASEEETPPTMTSSARAKLQGVWSSLRSIKVVDSGDEDTNTSKGKWTSDEQKNNESSGGTLENVMRSMFGSCGAFGEQEDSGEATISIQVESTSDRRTRERSKSSARRREGSSTSARAQQAVNKLREKEEQREASPSLRRGSLSRPFPSSDPPRKKEIKHQVPYLVHEVGPPPPPPNVGDLDAATFDDGISAISAHTLEELDRQEKLKLSKAHRFHAVSSDLTHEQGIEQSLKPTASTDSSLFSKTAEEERDRIGSPMELTRERSNNTYGSRRTFQSMSTESTDFEHVWRQEEQKYWEETVQKDESKPSTPTRKASVRVRRLSSRDLRDRNRSREQDMLTLKNDGTNTTTGSSSFSMSGSPQHSHHPHEIIPLDPSDYIPVRSPRRVFHDPDRIQGDMLLVDAQTEIGEI